MTTDRADTTPLGRAIVAGLEGLRDALEAGKPLEEAFRVAAMNKETGERVESRGPNDEEDEGERPLKDVTCPQCRKPFRLTWGDAYPYRTTLIIRGCPSGGIYDVSIECPHCDYEEPL